MEEVTTKTCKQGNIEKPITGFHTDKRSRDGHRVICKQCVKENLNSKKKKQMELTKVRGFILN
jgi:superfamily II helicase